MSKITENIIVVVIMVAIVVGLLCFVGYDNIKDWLSTPLIGKENEDITIQLISKETNKMRNEQILTFVIENATPETLTEYNFIVTLEGVELNLPGWSFSNRTIEPFDLRVLEYSISDGFMNSDGFSDEAITKIKNSNINDLQIDYKTEYIKTSEQDLINNNGTIKIITILVASLALGLLGLVNKFPVWLRITLKVCGLPIVLCLVVLFLFAKGKGDSSETQSSNDSQYREAQQRYNRAANLKAGAVSTGNRHSAAKAQEQMDKAMADMIMAKGSGSSSARDAAARYRREANLKAGATITGRASDAARAQANMDKALADMIKNK